jgi:4-amino-4-deoxy-L-arabinose transferase-like glycosyltransferase
MALWTVWPSLCIGNISIDVAENVAWGRNFDWGYDKNPYFGAWLSYAAFKLLPLAAADSFFYFMSQLSVAIGLLAAGLLARDIFKRNFPAFLVVVLSFLIPFFGHKACEFNDDVICIALYGATALFFYRGAKRNTAGNWIAAGICAGLALMTKYLAGILLLPLGILMLASKEGRACWKKPWIYLGIVIFALLVIPNVIWLFNHDFIAIRYAFGRADLTEEAVSPGVWERIGFFLKVWGDFLALMILPLVGLAIFRRGAPATDSKFDRAFVWTMALVPTALSSLFALVTGGRVLTGWTTPYYVFSALWLIMLYRPMPERASMKIFAGFMVLATLVMAVIFGREYAWYRPYRRSRCTYEVFPGRRMAEHITAEWRKRYGTPCPYVIGNRETSCDMCYYSADHPVAFFDHDVRQSPWISVEDLKKKGAVVIWAQNRAEKPLVPPRYLKRYPELIMLDEMKYDRAAPAWARRLFGRPPRPVRIRAAIIPPTP